MCKNVQVGNDQEKVQSERTSHPINRGVGKTNKKTLRNLGTYTRKHTASRVSSYSPIGGNSVT